MDLYLKFDSEAQATEYLYTQEPVEWDDSDPELLIPTAWEPRPNFANIDVIGVITEGGEWDEDGEVITEPVSLEGWHVNVRLVGEDGSALEPFRVEPEHPRRVWG
jgi:hypothetical protein